MLKYISVLTILITIAGFVSPVNSQSILTPDEAVKIALKNNYSIQIAKNQAGIASNNYSFGKAAFFPALDASASYTKSNSNTKQEYFDGRTIDRNGAVSNNLTSGIMLNWTIFDGFQMFAAFDKLKELKKSGIIGFKASVDTNVQSVLSTYYNIVRQQQVLQVIKRNIIISGERVKIAEEKKDVGSGSKFDLLSAQVDLNDDKSSLLMGEQDLSALKIQLNRLLGRRGDEDFSVIDTIAVDSTLSFDNLKSDLTGKNTDLLLAKQAKNSADLDLALAKSELYPVINLNLGYNYVKSESQAGFVKSNQNTAINYGVTASFNLFNGLDTRRKIENAKISIETSKYIYASVADKVNADLLNTFKQYKNSLELAKLEAENLKVAEENVAIALERLRLGNITPLDFREAQNKMLTTKSNLVAAEYSAKVAEVQLLRLSGRLVNKED